MFLFTYKACKRYKEGHILFALLNMSCMTLGEPEVQLGEYLFTRSSKITMLINLSGQ